MSGKPQFEDAIVINAAMHVFWRRGFTPASIDELTTAMNLSRSSLYKRFRDKEGLYQEVLAAYTNRVLRRMNDIQAASRRNQLEALLLAFIPRAVDPSKPSGCMLVRACTEMADLPPGAQTTALEGLAQQRAILSSILNTAVTNGELTSSADASALAWHFLGVLQAVMNLPQVGATASDLRRMVTCAMSAWPQDGDALRSRGAR